MKRFRQIFTLVLVPLDFVMIWLAFIAAYHVRAQWPVFDNLYLLPLPDYVKFTGLLSLLWIVVFFAFNLYRFRGYGNAWELATRILGATSVALAFFIIGLFITKTEFFSRLIVVYFWGLSFLFVFVGRALLGSFKQWLHYYGTGTEKVLLIGEGRLTQAITNELGNRWPAQKLVAALDDINFETLGQHKVDRIILGRELPTEDMVRLIRWCEDRGIVFQYAPSLVGFYKFHLTTDFLAGYPLVELAPTPLNGWGRVVKRLFDFGMSVIGIIITSPIILIVAVAIKLDSKGPIIFAQKRIGELGQPFVFYKFRSMKTELSTGEGYGGAAAEEYLEKLRKDHHDGDGLLFKMKDDPRITKVGKFIRKTSLDELPQFFNVLIGNMSLVGPRPALPNEVELYSDNLKRRLLVKPGVTGLWQVSGRSDAAFDDYVKLDTYYLENWSLWLDIKIIFLTFRAVVKMVGSY